MIINLGMAQNFQAVKFSQLTFPAYLQVDYVRVYQKDGQNDRISCDPADHPTKDYIQK